MLAHPARVSQFTRTPRGSRSVPLLGARVEVPHTD